MKIAHLCLSNFFIDGYRYQENELVRQHVRDGHEVVVIASTEAYSKGRVVYVSAQSYIGEEGARVCRLPYRAVLPKFLMRKVRAYPGVQKILEKEQPDLIIFHGMAALELLTVAKYVRTHPSAKLFVDNHADFTNSAKSRLSRELLHRWFYKCVLQAALPQIETVLCVSYNSIDFAKRIYDVPDDMCEFFPLGSVIVDEDYGVRRARCRASLGIAVGETLLVHTGKINWMKRTIEAIESFQRHASDTMRLVIAGVLLPEVKDQILKLVSEDSRISYIGWVGSEQLLDLLCAADVYLQPGSQSATMQMSLGARCPVILADVPSHRPFFNGNGWLVTTAEDLDQAIDEIARQPEALTTMAQSSFEIASQLLDYRQLARRLTNR